MIVNLAILNGSGDTKLTWDAGDPEQVAMIRDRVLSLKAKGYAFFLVDGNPADEVAAGQGALLVRKMTAEELVPATPAIDPVADPIEPEPAPASDPEPRRRGRPRKTKADAPETNVVAVRPVRGG